MSVFTACMCMHHVPKEGSVPWNWNGKWLWGAVDVGNQTWFSLATTSSVQTLPCTFDHFFIHLSGIEINYFQYFCSHMQCCVHFFCKPWFLFLICSCKFRNYFVRKPAFLFVYVHVPACAGQCTCVESEADVECLPPWLSTWTQCSPTWLALLASKPQDSFPAFSSAGITGAWNSSPHAWMAEAYQLSVPSPS
jgi:hypothetical protein